MLKQKIVENYFDSKIYTNQEILHTIEETKKEFSKKIVDVDINLNEFGVYVVTYYFKNQDNILQKIFLKIKKRKNKNQTILLQEKSKEQIKLNKEERKKEKVRKRFEKYSGNNYGEYKETKIYKPY